MGRDLKNFDRVLRKNIQGADNVKAQTALQHLIQTHSSLAKAVQTAMNAGGAMGTDLDELREDMNNFSSDLHSYAATVEVSNKTILKVIARAREVSNLRHTAIRDCKTWLEHTVTQTPRPPSPPQPQRAATTLKMFLASSRITGNMPLGVATISGSETVIAVNYLFGLVSNLQAKIDVLTKWSKSTGMIFQQLAFLSEAEFAYWYTSLNASGLELAAFDDLISIWAFALGNPMDTSQWLNAVHRSKAVGLKGESADAVYAHSMAQQYPTSFVGVNKTSILSTTTIKMLESYNAWQGTIMGDGQKEKLTADLQWAIQSHRKYCEDFVPEGILRNAAIKTAEVTLLFWTSLNAYIEDEYTILLLFKLLPKHILLLLSNQVVQICDNMFEFRNCTTNVDLQNPLAAATWFAWVTLQALGAMEGFTQSFVNTRPSIALLFVS
jgi:hypothetical protein